MSSALKGLGAAARLRAPLASSSRALSRRWNSNSPEPSSTQAGPKQVSPHVGFYKTFTRPVAKVLLLATFTYQLAYWTWVKLEKDEIKAEKNAEIGVLEKQLEGLTKKEKTP